MKQVILCLIILIVPYWSSSLMGQQQNPYDLILEANSATKAEKYDEAEEKYLLALELLKERKAETREGIFIENIQKGEAARKASAFLAALDFFEVAGQSTRISFRKDEADVQKSLTIIAIGRFIQKAEQQSDIDENANKENALIWKVKRYLALARASVTELRYNNKLNALHLANTSDLEWETLPIKSSNRAAYLTSLFGNAAYAYFQKRWDDLEGGIAQAVFFPNDHENFIILPNKSNPVLYKNLGQQSTLSNDFNGQVQFMDLTADMANPILLTGSTDQKLKLVSLVRPTESMTLQEADTRLRKAYFSPDNQLIVSISRSKEARLWRLPFQQEEYIALKGHDAQIVGSCFSPDNTKIATWDLDGIVKVWSVSGTEICSFQGFQQLPVKQLKFSNNSDKLLGWTNQPEIRIWNIKGKMTNALNVHSGDILEASFSPDDSKVLSCSADQTALIWDLSSNEHQVFDQHQHRVKGGTFSSDGQWVITHDLAGNLYRWNLNGQLVSSFKQHQGPITQLSVSQDGLHILTASTDRTAKLWNIDGELLMNMDGFNERVNVAIFSDDSRYILLGSEDGSVVWCPTPATALKQLDRLPPMSIELKHQFDIE